MEAKAGAARGVVALVVATGEEEMAEVVWAEGTVAAAKAVVEKAGGARVAEARGVVKEVARAVA